MRQKVKSLEDTGRIAKKSNKQKNKNRSTRRNKTYELTRSEAKILALHSRASQIFPSLEVVLLTSVKEEQREMHHVSQEIYLTNMHVLIGPFIFFRPPCSGIIITPHKHAFKHTGGNEQIKDRCAQSKVREKDKDMKWKVAT